MMTKSRLKLREFAPTVKEIQEDSRLRIRGDPVSREVVLENDPVVLPINNDRSCPPESFYSRGHDLWKLAQSKMTEEKFKCGEKKP
jgi:hypothetical protein